ncbi:hypothetical protein ACFT2C_06115 [Promicromonospora sp. NPDC057138]|uniref:Cas10/Cmr2 second palm domain-containing protein n=1 Tax=Promicromonospora sp. NPDC057138 TaxID=3346031 RepID=UPI00362A276C
MTSKVFVDVAAVRIQHYLSRSKSLRGRRAASGELAQATSREVIEEIVKPLAEINKDAGDVDSVVSLVFDDPGEGVRADWINRVEELVLAHLRKRLPAVELQSLSGVGDTYLEAYASQIGPAKRDGRVRRDLPPPAEFPLAQPCRACRVDPAVGHREVNGKSTALCLDCVMRNVSQSEAIRDEASPLGRLARHARRQPPDGFDDLVLLSDVPANRTQLATVAADGNAFGAFFTALARHGKDDEKEQISTSLSSAVFQALTAATDAVLVALPSHSLPVVPHVIGGDDVVVTLPADQAWRFTTEFLSRFDRAIKESVGPVVEKLAMRRRAAGDMSPVVMPSVSAGIVFAHYAQPFGLVMEAAERQLKQAKRGRKGARAAISWLDVTTDGYEHPGRSPVDLATLREDDVPSAAARGLDRLSGTTSSHRAQLVRALRTADQTIAASVALRNGTWEQVRPFIGDNAEISLDQALSIVRWWR